MVNLSIECLVLIWVVLLTEQSFEYRSKDSNSQHATYSLWDQLPIENKKNLRDDKNDSICQNAGGGLPTLFRLTLRAHGCEFRIHARALGSAATFSRGCALRVALSVAEGADRIAPIHAAFAGSLPHVCCGGYVKGYFAHAGDIGFVRTAVDLMSPRTDIAAPRDLAKLAPADCNHRPGAGSPPLLASPQRYARPEHASPSVGAGGGLWERSPA
jgi:hypothetical protein